MEKTFQNNMEIIAPLENVIPTRVGTSLGVYDFSRFDIHFYIKSSIDNVFRGWSTAAGLESFFIERATFQSSDRIFRQPNETVQSGDNYRWTWHNGASMEGQVLSVDQNKIEFSFGEPGRLSVAVSKSDEGPAYVHLVQSEIPANYEELVHTHINCRGAWIHFLTCLKARLEFGVDVREFNPELSSSLSTAYDFKIRKQNLNL